MCGIFGILLADGRTLEQTNLPVLAVNGLTALQHRGTESTGIVGSDGIDNDHINIVKGHGLVRDVYDEVGISTLNDSRVLIGHNRYSTAGLKNSGINCVQPFVVYTAFGTIGIAHNGEVVNAKNKRKELLDQGVGLSTDTDSELIAQMIAKAVALNKKCRNSADPGDISKELAVTMMEISMSFSLLVMTFDRIYAIRDPYGNRPLAVATVYDDSGALAYCAASETCAFPSKSKLNFEVSPGEVVEITKTGIRSVFQMKPTTKQAMCIFEYVYFARSDSVLEGQQVQTAREECGRALAEEDDVSADIVGNVPDSSMSAAIGYATQAGIPYEPCFHRNSYVGRSFIQPSNQKRVNAINQKFGVLQKKIEGKRIVLVDDSIVRGNTMRVLVKMLKEAGAAEVHLRIASPPVKYPCFMGINIPTQTELIAANKTNEEMKVFFGADSVKYLSVEGLEKAVQTNIKKKNLYSTGHCMACLNQDYPVPMEI